MEPWHDGLGSSSASHAYSEKISLKKLECLNHSLHRKTVPPDLETALRARTSSVSLAGGFMVRDGEPYLRQNIEHLLKLGESFRKLQLFFVENDSTDRTRPILRSYMLRHPKVFRGVMLDGVSKNTSELLCPMKLGMMNCKRRTMLLGALRSRVMELARHDAPIPDAPIPDTPIPHPPSRPPSYPPSRLHHDSHRLIKCSAPMHHPHPNSISLQTQAFRARVLALPRWDEC